ncbi:MAG: hypothetical protein KC925_02990 [Candidatus Doudnabacteria bacterium]|nr:hypothetical protein [Candidatus Doudnabacteria bacterium]
MRTLLASTLLMLGLIVSPVMAEAGGSLGYPSGMDKATPSEVNARVSGKILLQIEERGEAYYVYPGDGRKYYLGRPADAFDIMRYTGLGISDADLAKIPAEGTSWDASKELLEKVRGRILLQVEQNGEAWYVNPATGKRTFLNRPADAFDIMREKGVGVTNETLEQVQSEIMFYRPTRSDIDLNSKGASYITHDYIGITNAGVVPRTFEGWKIRFEDGTWLRIQEAVDSKTYPLFAMIWEYDYTNSRSILGGGGGSTIDLQYWSWMNYPYSENTNIELVADTGSVVEELQDVDAYLRASGETFNESNGYY